VPRTVSREHDAATSSLNPFGLIDVGTRSAPALGNIDGDGDPDAFVGDLLARHGAVGGHPDADHDPTDTPTTTPTDTPTETALGAPRREPRWWGHAKS
jgi:hypothetical protein